MGEKNDKSKYMEGNYSKDPFKAELEYRDDLIQAEQLQMEENYWKSYLNAAEKLRKEHHYLVDGAVLRCSKSTTNPIIITQSKGQLLKYEECTDDMLVGEAVVLEDPDNMECFRAPEGKSEVRLKVLQNTAAINGAGQYFATVKDTKKGGIGYYFDHDTDDYNIRFFGNCKNAPDRDDECKAIITAAESKELRNIGTCPYLMKLNDEWENFVSDVNYEEVTTLDGELSELITMEAVLFCKHGGFITPITSGQVSLVTQGNEFQFTKEQLIACGWDKVTDEQVKKLNESLIYFGIDSAKSAFMMLATMLSESECEKAIEGKDKFDDKSWEEYKEKLRKSGNIVGNYGWKERGAGYIQLTGEGIQRDFLTRMGDSYNGDIPAEYIAPNYPIEAAVYYWTEVNKTGAGNLNAYVEQYAKDDNMDGIFLISQYFVNGYVDGIDEALSKIRKGEKFKINSITHKLEVNGKSYQLPNGWYDRELNWGKAYNELQKIK